MRPEAPDPSQALPPALAADLVAARSVEEMVDRFLSEAIDRLGAFAVGVYVHDQATGQPAFTEVRGLGSYYVRSYERHGREQDPVVQVAMSSHALCDSDALMPEEQWRRLPVVREIFGPHAMARVLCAPFVVGGRVVGTLNLARHDEQPRFDDADRSAARTAAAVLGTAVVAVSERTSLARERDQLIAALDRCRTPVVVTDLRTAARHVNAPAAELVARTGMTGRELSLLLECDEVRAVRSWDGPGESGTGIVATSQRLPGDAEVVVSVLDVPARDAGAVERGIDPELAGALTPREAEIAACALRGRSDREIAAELFLSTHTVKHHMKAVYAKLGVHSRAQLLARLRP
ncbi:LuxR C-terminal-related transcriptional regulator [Nocardioides sp. BYT-33-1]|uniref:LuxR C-terminal-related transcriptional regulator n=1 Tax=Nocardioides sp. BYT-33-1 TaxID=3416952 RepID=UPI003F539E5C